MTLCSFSARTIKKNTRLARTGVPDVKEVHEKNCIFIVF